MMNKRKITWIFSIVLTLILCCTSVFVPFLNKTQSKVFAEGTNNSVYAFVSRPDNKVNDGKIYVDFGLSIDVGGDGVVTREDAEEMSANDVVPFESAKVYIRTRNLSAIAEQGDYESMDQVVTMLGTNPYNRIAVRINYTGLQVNGVARQFYVEIYKVEITGLKGGYTFLEPNTTPDVSRESLSAGAEFSIGTVTRNYTTHTLDALDLGGQYHLIPETKSLDVATNTWFNDIQINLANYGWAWYDKIKYLSDHDMAKLGMWVAVAAYEAPNGVYTDNSFVGVQVFAGDSRRVGAPALEGVPTKNIYTDSSVTELARWYAKFQSDERESLYLGDAYSGNFDGVTVSTLFNEHVYVADAVADNNFGQGGVFDFNVGEVDYYRLNMFLIDDLDAVFHGSTTLSTRFWKYRSGKDKYYNGSLHLIPTNYRAEVLSATPGHVFKDENGKEKIGLSLRFSEPVQLKRYNDGTVVAPSMEGYINGNAVNELTFKYSSGDGTDTLFFEADVSSYKMNVTKLSIRTAHGFQDVYDFPPSSTTGGNNPNYTLGSYQFVNVMHGNLVNGWANISTETLLCSYDLREPEIDVNGSATQTVKTSHTTTIRTAYISETGMLHYGWTTDDQTIPQVLTKEPISSQGFQTVSSPSGVSGVRYLYAIAVSEIGKQSEPMWVGPFHFDNEAPTLSVECTTNTYKVKQFTIHVTNNTIDGFEKFSALKSSIRAVVSSDAAGQNKIKEMSIQIPDSEQGKASTTIENFTLTAEMLGLAQGYGTYYVTFTASDMLENQYVSEPISYYFDVREIFNATLIKESGMPDFEMDEFKSGTEANGTLGESYYTIDLSKKETGRAFGFTLETDDETVALMAVDDFTNVVTGESMLSKIHGDGTKNRLSVSIVEDFDPGLYCLIVKDGGSDKKSLPIYFYVTKGKVGGVYQEMTGGYQTLADNTAFTNRVFQMPTDVPYYYLTDTGMVKTQSYSETTKPASFSSWSSASSYILYREYLDLYAITLSQSLASDLNTGIYRKAEGTTQRAETGQVWVRYKEVNWRPNSTTSEWVYYYYGADQTSLPLNVNALSNELQLALNTVAGRICTYGAEVDLVTQEHLDNYGAPTLVPEQMHLQAESASVSMSGTAFQSPIEYLGDFGMYLSLDPDAPLSTNAPLPTGEYRRIYYKTEGSEYHLLTKDTRETFGQYLNATGKFYILELDENGAREYCIYVDKSAPTVTVSWKTQNNGTQSKEFSQDDNGQTISGNNFYIESIQDYDTLSFVAIYRYTSQGEGDLLSVYRKSDFDKGQGIRLEDGKYHVHVSDRSGNSYAFVLQMKSDPLVCAIKEVGNSYIRFEVNRSESEIRYQVYLDGVILTTDFNEKRFTEGGQYRFLVEDIYGNVFDETYIFERDLPTVTWRYQISDGSYALYEQDNERITIQKIDDQNYIISTSAYLRFLPLEGCTYAILSGTPNPTQNASSGWVSLNNLTAFTMKVFYEQHPNTYVTYTCIVDNAAPQVNVTYEKGYFQTFDVQEIQEILANGGFVLGDNPFTPTAIGFAALADKTATLYVANGQFVQSKYFKVQVSDESGVKEVKVYLDGELILTEKEDFSHIYVSRRGAYQIVATDSFGNASTFSFINEYDERVEYFVDGEKVSTDVSYGDYFSEKTYTKVEYGNTQTEIKILSSVEIHYLITDEDGNAYYFAFAVEDGVMYTLQYTVKIVEGEYGLEIENISSRGVKSLTSGEVAKIDKLGVAIYLSKNSNGVLSLSVRSTDSVEKKYTVETRVSVSENEMPYYFKTEISTIPSFVEFTDGDGNLLNASQTVKVNEAFMVRKNVGADIESVRVAYSQSGEYTVYETVYDGVYYDHIFEKEGAYHVVVVNRYGIQTDYYVVLSSQFVMTATLQFADGMTVNYSTDYTKTHDEYYSNRSVEFIVYSANVTVLDKPDEVSVTPTQQGYTIVYMDRPGRYSLIIQDEYGNTLEKEVHIAMSMFMVGEGILTNFNDKALRRDENYTNQMIYINKSMFLQEREFAFIEMVYGDKTISIYDQISENKTEFDESQCVGLLGDGMYTLVFRDRYGNKTETIIYYCGTPTLTILRNTLNGVGAEEYPLEEMQANGVWTNDKVRFVISATEYRLTVDGKENVSSIAYETKTKNEYEVYYLDEYGFEYTFKVYLHREDVEIAPADGTAVTQQDDLLVTKDSVKMDFTENALCTYTLNNETEKVYNAGDVLYKDGIYHFKAVDKAGNISTYTLKKDSTVEYRLEGTGAGEIMVNGGVTNGHSVRFYPENSDSAYIKKVFHNNEFIDYDDETFTERGKWELIVADDAGNESYFKFYILYGKLDGFSYNTPYNYVITSVMWEMESSIAEATETIKESGLRLETNVNGKYTVTMESLVTGDKETFSFTIDRTPPKVELVGCQENEKTINNVTLKGCSVGDTVYVYKDGALVKTLRITSEYISPPTIDEAGKYRIVVENEAGIQTELSFERKYVPNVAGSVLIIVLALGAVAGLFVGLIWRNHSKTDD